MRWRRVALVVLVAAVLYQPARPAGAAPDQRASCEAVVNGEPISRHAQASHPLEVDASGTLDIVAQSLAPSGFVKVEVDFPLFSSTLLDLAFSRPTNTARAVVDVSDVSDYGVGLYDVRVSVEGCSQRIWVRITGKSPLATPAGVIAAGVTSAGLLLLMVSLVRTVRGSGGKGAFVLALVSGAVAGAGAVGVSQQFGWVGITDKILTTWTGIPALGGAALQQAALFVTRRGAVATTPVEAPPVEAPLPRPTEAEPPPTAGAEPPGEEEAEPPRSAYARIEAPEAVVAEETFELIVGLAAEPTAGVVGPQLIIPPTVHGSYTLTIQVMADGFALRGGRWRRELLVTAEQPYPFVVYKLAARAKPNAEVWAQSIQALYSVEGQTIGMAVRSVAVVARADLLDHAPVTPFEPASTVAVPTHEVAADLTVRILHAVSESDGRLQWTFEVAKRLDIDTPDEQVITDIGAHPETFTRDLIQGVGAKRNDPGLYDFLRGIGATVADQMPDAFFDILAAVAAKVGHRRPTLLLLSEEPYVPWELALLDPPLDAATQPYLGAQVDVGRWVLGSRKPALPPPVTLDVGAVAVVSGVYDKAEWRLVDAEEEAAAIASQYGATPVDATGATVSECLDGVPEAEVLHFAVHGVYNPDSALEGLILVDGSTLDLITVRGKKLAYAPFVFLNACQVGNGERVLGDYAGLAGSFLRAGASGALAPLWSIDDAAAKEMALRFYERTLEHGEPPAAVVRAERASFADPGRDGAATCLAYQFFGHPQLRLKRP